MKKYTEIYRIEQFPVFQNRMFQSEQAAKDCTKGDVILVQDLETGLIFNQAFNPNLLEYNADYQNEQAVSAVFQNHLQNVANIVQSHFTNLSLIEVGCGKGYFLELLQGLGFQITGLDPAYEGSNSSVIRNTFCPEIGLRADGIILRHVLEHMQDPFGFLSQIYESNGGYGKIYIEVPCFDWICKHRAWFDIFYEHVNYFRFNDFHRIFGKIYEIDHTFGGQYLYVVADLASLKKPVYDESSSFQFPGNFLDTINYYTNKIKNKPHETSTVIWGGASKGVIFALITQRFGANVDIIVDINPSKQGKYIPGSGLRVNSPNEALGQIKSDAIIFVMNSNYTDEIKELTCSKYSYVEIDNEYV